MTLAFRYAARSDVGLIRSTNQDSGYAGPHLLVLADGMGGPAGGDIASSIAIAHLAPLDGESHTGDMLTLLRDAVVEAHSELRQRALDKPELAGLGTTLIAALRTGKKLALVHIGDSRAYLVRGEEVTRLTTDHTYVQHLVDAGQLDPEEAENHPHRSVILRVLGDHDLGVDLDESVRELHAGERFLLCSDGVSSFVSHDTIVETLTGVRDPGECADQLVDLALRAGGPDNITAVVADVVELDELPDGAAPDTSPQVVGSAASQWQRPTRGATGAAGRAAALTAAASTSTEEEDDATPDAKRARKTGAEDDGEPRPRRRRTRVLVISLVVALVLAAAGVSGYRWTQTQHYVAASGEFVAVYRGIPQELGPLRLSSVVDTTDLRVDELPQFAQDRLAQGITPESGSLADAEELVESLRAQSTREDADDGGAGGTDDGGAGGTDAPTDPAAPTSPAAPTDPAQAPAPTEGATS
ncbi:PP2C family protein-serine/threonine phosphatase [Litorihabitans aurantiacus]|uniref:Serine/threonine protein phosphatase n=1 Tax=Litorihabitans aurantiacus TaxID=1930061 RepID=A0AA37XHP9_9MICO|nr:PP2C family serine/threonine-protein phosphatase [Litorihabitans aurantiacus]GMA33112.1 serine/threonine protein phosphatase [Litorihabitans aurantiacus]